MKDKIIQTAVTILCLPLIVLFLLVVLLMIPFDYFKYKRTQYYKDTHDKYSLFCAMSYCMQFYDLIKKENLPIDYYRSDSSTIAGEGYFVYNDILILSDYDDMCFDSEKNTWTVEIEDEYVDIKGEVEADIEKCNDFLKGEVCKRAAVLVHSDIYEEHPEVEYEKFDFIPVYNNDNLSALKKVIE